MFRRVAESRGMRALGSVLVLASATAAQPAQPPQRVSGPMDLVQRRIAGALPVRPVPQDDRACLASRPAPRPTSRPTRSIASGSTGNWSMHGPARSSRGKATVDPVDVGRYLAQGQNTLMIEVFHGVCPFEALAQAPGLLCELEADVGGKRDDPRRDRRHLGSVGDHRLEPRVAAVQLPAGLDGAVRRAARSWRRSGSRRSCSARSGMAPWKKVEMRDIPLPAPLCRGSPARRSWPSSAATGLSADFDRSRDDLGSSRGPSGTGVPSGSGGCTRSTCAPTPRPPPIRQGVTDKGQGDTVLQGDGAVDRLRPRTRLRGIRRLRGDRPRRPGRSRSPGTSGSPATAPCVPAPRPEATPSATPCATAGRVSWPSCRSSSAFCGSSQRGAGRGDACTGSG